MTDYIYDVHQVARDTGMGIICRCPHCQAIIGIEGEMPLRRLARSQQHRKPRQA
ncbi:hypothetical protein [Pseudomonas sp. DSP3-2-2]|uniref:hypothetical protein n=1 Tax=unclassified Pseudomonas TaxID=196821 RepID=UPI003CF53A03